jgi:glyoxylate/hydroxypyruvate reductase A
MSVLLIGEIDFCNSWFNQFIAEFKIKRPDLDLRVWPECGDEEDIYIALACVPPVGALQKFPNLKLVISLRAGVNHILRDTDLPRHITITRLISFDIQSKIADYVLLVVLFFQRRFPDYQQLQQSRQWKYLTVQERKVFVLGILGLGYLGSFVAKKLSAFGFPVCGWSRTPKTIKGVECFYGQEQLKPFLSKCCVAICLLPLTYETKGILNMSFFYALPQGAYLINVARGKHLVEADLLSALDSGQIAGACLDVFDTEPLSEKHPFWSHPRIIVTPHVSGVTTPENAVTQTLDAINCFQMGKRLNNVVNMEQGY